MPPRPSISYLKKICSPTEISPFTNNTKVPVVYLGRRNRYSQNCPNVNTRALPTVRYIISSGQITACSLGPNVPLGKTLFSHFLCVFFLFTTILRRPYMILISVPRVPLVLGVAGLFLSLFPIELLDVCYFRSQYILALSSFFSGGMWCGINF